jgi:hypothetical protein
MTDTMPVATESTPAPAADKYLAIIAGRTIDLRRALPLTSRDYVQMEKIVDEDARVGLKHIQTQDFNFSRIVTFVERAAVKADPAITRSDVEDLPFPELARMFAVVMEAADQGINRPTSSSSSSQPKPGAGVQPTWDS